MNLKISDFFKIILYILGVYVSVFILMISIDFILFMSEEIECATYNKNRSWCADIHRSIR